MQFDKSLKLYKKKPQTTFKFDNLGIYDIENDELSKFIS